jgi:alkylation response protein AidB-like acyl-CoA dehydrogenase
METSPEGFSRSLYAQLAELGYLGLLLDDAAGGSGMGPIGLAAVLHEMGRVALPGPYLELVLSIETLRMAGGDVAQRWLRDAIAGEKIVLPAARESLSGVEPATLATRFEGGRVRGLKTFVAHGAAADGLIVTTAQGFVLVERPASGWSATPLETLDHAQRFVEIALDAPGTLLADGQKACEIAGAVGRLAAFGAAAFLLGLEERCLELTVDYLQERKAFGVPIGSFQALQHRAADMLLRVESSRATVYRAAWALEQDPGQAPLLVAAAKAYCADSARLVCGETIQLFGGVGYTWEYDPHIYFKRVKTLEQLHGSSREQLEQALRAVGV